MTATSQTYQVLIADSQFLVTESLRQILAASGEYEVLGVARYAYQLKALLDDVVPDLLITDYATIDYEGLEALKTLMNSHPQMAVLVLTNQVIKADLLELSKMGIKNIICKTTDKEELFMAINFALRNRKFFSEEVLEVLMDEPKRKANGEETHHLTTTETEVVKLIAEGKTTKEIAAQKNISFHTVMTHRKNIFRKLGVNSSSELIMYAIRAGWIDNIEYYI
ncbi:response regulator transcription factor [Geofilum rubicundum]|uniref:Putative two-component system response regulator n=1 Tax=Geofilum rubicundum JCM 15548 TaxID=1236989 RepID=A0A0E9M208_9BACT|nr:response regulator transcription factor [Geofilum rubicundum]GAO31628.1 putative two-component system response regulator [Geofilum rubicundum JCM 15548]